MTQKLSEIPEEKREAERAKRKEYKARYRANMTKTNERQASLFGRGMSENRC